MKTRNFKSVVQKLSHQVNENPQQPHSMQIGIGDSSWTVFYCPPVITAGHDIDIGNMDFYLPKINIGHYYAMNMASGDCIQSSISSIYRAYRINRESGDAITTATGNPRWFAVKVFTGNKIQNREMAENETLALRKNQFAELTYSANGQPMIIMDYHPGEPLCTTNGTPNHALLKLLSLAQRLTLILQIAVQYQDIHRKYGIHVDVKGSNIVIHVADNNGAINANVIDFGSAKKIPAGMNEVPTGLSGLTPYIIPPEAVEKNRKAYLSTDKDIVTGYLNEKSDIYGLSAVCATLLGANNPYQNRQSCIIGHNNFFAMQVVQNQIQAGFNFDGLLSKRIKGLSYGIRTGSHACAFRNFSTIEAPNDKTISALKVPEPCYILYQDQLLYIDKSKVLGRKNTKPVSFKKSVEDILTIDSTNELAEQHVRFCSSIANFHCYNETPLDDLLRPLIEIFIYQMAAKNHKLRPSMEEFVRFFTIANKFNSIIKNESASKDTIEQQINIALIQLNLIIYKAWGFESVSQFNFNSLEEKEHAKIFSQFCQLLSNQEILNGTEELTEKHFGFLTPHTKYHL